jgi:hypothetical protein
MKFVPVAGTQVLFSVWDTRVQDFETFVKSTDYDATGGMYSIGMGTSALSRLLAFDASFGTEYPGHCIRSGV